MFTTVKIAFTYFSIILQYFILFSWYFFSVFSSLSVKPSTYFDYHFVEAPLYYCLGLFYFVSSLLSTFNGRKKIASKIWFGVSFFAFILYSSALHEETNMEKLSWILFKFEIFFGQMETIFSDYIFHFAFSQLRKWG